MRPLERIILGTNKSWKCFRFLKVIRLGSKVKILPSGNPLTLLGYWTIDILSLPPTFLVALVYVRSLVKVMRSKVNVAKVKVTSSKVD